MFCEISRTSPIPAKLISSQILNTTTSACSVSPFPHAQWSVGEINGRKMDTYMRWLAITYGVTMTIHPVAVIPCGVDARGLPFGIQIVGRYRGDAELLAIAHSLERAMAGDKDLARPLPDLAKLRV